MERELENDEIWIPVKDYPYYEVSNLGNVRSWLSRGISPHRLTHPRMVGRMGSKGYKHVTLINDTGRRDTKISRVVAENFLFDRPPNTIVTHLNGNRLDDRVTNLAWRTYKDNSQDRYTHGTMSVGQNNPNHKLTEQEVIEIFNSNMTNSYLARVYDISRANVWEIKTGHIWGWLTNKNK